MICNRRKKGMSESRFMKTVPFGGYDRAGVEARFEQLSAQIFSLQNELSDTKKLIGTLQSGGSEFESLQQMLEENGTARLKTGCKMIELLRRPQIGYAQLAKFDENRPALPYEIFEQVEISVKYEGYIKKQEAQIKELRRIEAKEIPENIDYKALKGLRLEAVEKLSKIRPQNLGQASRISGVNPADITALNIILEGYDRQRLTWEIRK
jgi:glucose-inhibited division protein A